MCNIIHYCISMFIILIYVHFEFLLLINHFCGFYCVLSIILNKLNKLVLIHNSLTIHF